MNELTRLRRLYDGYTPRPMGFSREFAVLCPLVEKPDGLHLLFEVRAANIRQGGEVCFPGGKTEPGESAVQCALRETEEELSIPSGAVEILGTADFICSQRGFLLQPVLGLVSASGMEALHPSPAEVASVFTVPLAFFQTTEPQIHRYDLVPDVPDTFPYEAVGISREYPWSRSQVDVPIWYYEDHVIWGLTARIIRNLTEHKPNL